MKSLLKATASLATGCLVFFLPLGRACATTKQEVYITGTVESFGGYTLSGGFQFTIEKSGEQTLGSIVVDGMYNGEYPWIMRIYTDNLHFAGVGGAIHHASPSGLVSKDGRFSIPLLASCPNFGADVWRRVPDLGDPNYLPYQHSSVPEEAFPTTDCILMGIDPRNAPWVAGSDGLLYTDDDNVLGDTTIPSPFEIVLRAEIPSAAVQGEYDAFLYVEIVPSP